MLKNERKYYAASFLTAFAIIAIAMLPNIIRCKGVFEYYGDYNAQYLFFFENCINAIKSGCSLWDWNTELGVNFIGSYGLNALASPFFWITVLFPASWSRYFLAPVMAVKFGFCAVFSYAYIRRFVKNPHSAYIGSLLYTFSGFSLYNLVFYHFHETLCFFPLLLIALEEAVINKRRGVFALAVALSALNYFFFFAECIFLVIYFISRMICSSEFRIKVKDFFCLAFESITGVMLAGALLLPAALAVTGSNKIGSFLTDMDFLFYNIPEYYGNIIKSMFYVGSVAGRKTFFPHIESNWDSATIYLPLFAMVGVIAFFCYTRKHWAKLLLTICLVIAFVPGFNAAFTLFNSMYYARWFFMPALICATVTAYAIENVDIASWKKGIGTDAMVIGIMSVLLIFHPVDRTYTDINEFGDEVTIPTIFPRFMTEMSMDYIYGLSILTALILLALYLIIRNRRTLNDRKALNALTAAVIVCSVGLSSSTIWAGIEMDEQSVYVYGDYIDDEVVIDDDSTYRVDITAPIFDENMNMVWGMYSPKSFNSIVPSSVYEIYELLQTNERTEATTLDIRYIAQYSLLGVKYFVVHEDMVYSDEKTSAEDTLASGYKNCVVIDKQGEYYIAENTYAIPMGYAYDEYILARDTKDKYKDTAAGKFSYVDRILVECVALRGDQVEKYSDILTEIPPDESDDVESVWNYDRLAEAAAARRAAGVEEFSFGKNSFHAKTAYDSDELVVFSVPYDKGWSAVIDGAPAEFDKVNGGFIAIRVPAGEHSVDFTYMTPGLKLGIIITIAGAVLIAAWFVLWYVILKKGTQPRCGDSVSAHVGYIEMASKTVNSEDK